MLLIFCCCIYTFDKISETTPCLKDGGREGGRGQGGDLEGVVVGMDMIRK